MAITPIQQLREVHEVQGRNGCWDIDDYMLGLYNGLELALSIMENRDCKYKERPEQWWGTSSVMQPDYVADQARKTEELRATLTDEDIKAVFERYGKYADGKDYALIRAVEALLEGKL